MRFEDYFFSCKCSVDCTIVVAQPGKPEANPFDLLCHLASNTPVLTRRQRADRVNQQHVAFFKFLAPEARIIVDCQLKKYTSDGELQSVAVRRHLPDVLKLPPISQHGNVNEIICKFGVPEELCPSVYHLQELLCAD
jgi:type I restriction enzyme R subunit